MYKPCYIIAEIGVNHNADIELAKKLVEVAKTCGADAVKFQTFTANALVTNGTPKVNYQSNTTPPDESHFEMIRKLELSRKEHLVLVQHCKLLGIDFISTPYDISSGIFLNELDIKAFKTASADIVDIPLHKFLAKTKKPVIIATGMASLGEIETVVEIYRKKKAPSMTLLHCVSNYPCSDASLNLQVIKTLQQSFQLDVGFSDHSIGTQAAVIALAFGATIIEKHFTIDKSMSGPDHKASSDPKEFRELVENIRRAEVMLGSPTKMCQTEEEQMAKISRKSITLAQPLKNQDVLNKDNLVMKRPGTGIMPSELPKLIGKKVRYDLPKNYQLKWTDLDE